MTGLGSLGAALGRLSPEHRAVVVMRYLLELTPGEIAEALELPRGTVNSRLRRGLDALGARPGGGAVRVRFANTRGGAT